MSKAVDKITQDPANSKVLDSHKRSVDSDSLEVPDPGERQEFLSHILWQAELHCHPG